MPFYDREDPKKYFTPIIDEAYPKCNAYYVLSSTEGIGKSALLKELAGMQSPKQAIYVTHSTLDDTESGSFLFALAQKINILSSDGEYSFIDFIQNVRSPELRKIGITELLGSLSTPNAIVNMGIPIIQKAIDSSISSDKILLQFPKNDYSIEILKEYVLFYLKHKPCLVIFECIQKIDWLSRNILNQIFSCDTKTVYFFEYQINATDNFSMKEFFITTFPSINVIYYRLDKLPLVDYYKVACDDFHESGGKSPLSQQVVKNIYESSNGNLRKILLEIQQGNFDIIETGDANSMCTLPQSPTSSEIPIEFLNKDCLTILYLVFVHDWIAPSLPMLYSAAVFSPIFSFSKNYDFLLKKYLYINEDRIYLKSAALKDRLKLCSPSMRVFYNLATNSWTKYYEKVHDISPSVATIKALIYLYGKEAPLKILSLEDAIRSVCISSVQTDEPLILIQAIINNLGQCEPNSNLKMMVLRLYYSIDAYELAYEYLTKLEKSIPNKVPLALYKIAILNRLEKNEEALDLSNRICTEKSLSNRENFILQNLRIITYASDSNYAEAYRIYNSILTNRNRYRSYPEYKSFLCNSIFVLSPEKALPIVAQAINETTENPYLKAKMLISQAVLLLRMNRIVEALTILTNAMQLSQGNTRLQRYIYNDKAAAMIRTAENLETALDYLKISLLGTSTLYEKLNICNNLFVAHALIGNVEECQYLEEEIFPLLLIENRPTIKCIVLHNFLCFHGNDAPESIVAEYKKAKEDVLQIKATPSTVWRKNISQRSLKTYKTTLLSLWHFNIEIDL